jgi:dephospho-CoA kinase
LITRSQGWRMKKTLKIGLTGGMGAGKSLVLDFLLEKGIPVLQTDHLGHQLLEEKRFSRSIIRHFGKGILEKDGRIDREKLGQQVFSSPLKRAKLNRLLHPEILRRVQAWASREARKIPHPPLVVVEIPLLFESGSDRLFDRVLCVSAPLLLRRKRLIKKGLTLGEIKQREKSQWSQKRKNRAADWVIFNSGSRKELKYAVNRWLETMK